MRDGKNVMAAGRVIMILLALVVGFCPVALSQGNNCKDCVMWNTGGVLRWACEGGFEQGAITCTLVADDCNMSGICPAGGCFLAGTPILTIVGLVSIEDIKPGDQILTRDNNGTLTAATVVDTYFGIATEYIVINGDNNVTASHPFLTPNGWTYAGELKIGDTVYGDGMVAIIVHTVEHRNNFGVRVYNLSIDGSHIFTANGLLVHNKPPQIQD